MLLAGQPHYCTATVACWEALLAWPTVSTTGWSPEPMPSGTRAFTWNMPHTWYGATPAYRIWAGWPPMVRLISARLYSRGTIPTDPSTHGPIQGVTPVAKSTMIEPGGAGFSTLFAEHPFASQFRMSPCPLPV